MNKKHVALAFQRGVDTPTARGVSAFALRGTSSRSELFFRGALQPAVGLVPASLIFGLIHIGPERRFWPWTVFAVVVGFILGALYELTGDLAGPIVDHVCINALNMHAIVRLPSEDVEGGAGSLEL